MVTSHLLYKASLNEQRAEFRLAEEVCWPGGLPTLAQGQIPWQLAKHPAIMSVLQPVIPVLNLGSTGICMLCISQVALFQAYLCPCRTL